MAIVPRIEPSFFIVFSVRKIQGDGADRTAS
jgi:hypothetical protein